MNEPPVAHVHATVIPYADLPARWGVSVIRDDAGLRIIIPTTPRWTNLGTGYYAAGFAFSVLLAVFTVAAVQRRSTDAIPDMAVCGAGLLMVFFAALHRLHRRLIFHVNDRVSVAVSVPFLSDGEWVWAREDVRTIKLNPSDDKLLIRVAGRDLLQLFVSPSRELTEWVAKMLNEALQTPWTGPVPARPPLSDSPTPRMRRILLNLSACMMLGGCVLLAVGGAWSVVGIYVLLLAAAPVGIALGTQEKDYCFF